MNIPLLVCDEHGPALVVVRMHDTLWTALCVAAIEQLVRRAALIREYQRARVHHLALAERSHITQLLTTLR